MPDVDLVTIAEVAARETRIIHRIVFCPNCRAPVLRTKTSSPGRPYTYCSASCSNTVRHRLWLERERMRAAGFPDA